MQSERLLKRKEVDFEKDSIEVLKSSQVVLGSLLPVEMFKDTPEPRLALGLMNQDEINQAVPDNLVKPTKFPISLNTISLHTLQTVKTTQSPTIEPIKDMLCLAEPSQEVIDISAIDSSDSIVSDELDKESFFQNSKYLLIFWNEILKNNFSLSNHFHVNQNVLVLGQIGMIETILVELATMKFFLISSRKIQTGKMHQI